jgi:putative salt-induced outer membrane protein YdiY
MMGPRSSPRAAAAAALLLLGSVLSAGLAWGYERDKSDVVVLRNGDRISGDIHSLEFGILTLSTDNMETLSIEWPAVRSLTSKFEFAIERRDGTKYYGSIATSADGADLVITSAGGTVRFPMSELERISRFSSRFWDRINGGLSVGFSYSKSSSIQVSNVNFNANYRSTTIDSTVAFSSNTTKDSSGSTTNRELLSGAIQFLRQSRNFWGLLGSLERDQSLGIDARLTAGAGIGRRFVQTTFSELTGVVGLVGTEEWIVDKPEPRASVEAVAGGSWQVFKFVDPKTRLNLSLYVFPSLTESGRYRSTGDLSLTHKFPHDITVGLTGYLSYDNQPPEAGAEKSDYGITFNLGYSFGQ